MDGELLSLYNIINSYFLIPNKHNMQSTSSAPTSTNILSYGNMEGDSSKVHTAWSSTCVRALTTDSAHIYKGTTVMKISRIRTQLEVLGVCGQCWIHHYRFTNPSSTENVVALQRRKVLRQNIYHHAVPVETYCFRFWTKLEGCLLYTSDAADE